MNRRRARWGAAAVGLIGAMALVSSCIPPPDDPPSTTTSSTTTSSTTTTSTTSTTTTSTTTTTVPADSTSLSVTGHLEYFGVAQVGQRQIRVRTYGADHSEVVLVPSGYFITVDATAPYGSFSTVIPLRSDVASVNLIVEHDTPDGTAYFPSGSYPAQANQQTSAVYNTHGSYVELDGKFLKDGVDYTQPFYASVQAYDSNDSAYDLTLQTGVYPNPSGEATVTMYVPYDSFGGGDPSTDPTTLEFDFWGFDDSDYSASYTVDLDSGPAFYKESATVNIEQVGAGQ